MADNNFRFRDTRAGTAGGTLLAILLRLDAGEVMQTVVFSAVGAAVSFIVSVGLRWLVKKARGNEAMRQ